MNDLSYKIICLGSVFVSKWVLHYSVLVSDKVYLKFPGGCPWDVMLKAVDCKIVVSSNSSCVLHSLLDKYTWERYDPPYPPHYGLNSTTTVLHEGWLWHLITYKCLYAIKQRNQTKPNQTKPNQNSWKFLPKI